MKKVQVYRQGDVILRPVDSIPTKDREEIKPDNGRTILAYGETTGHAHALPVQAAKRFVVGSQEFVNISKATQLRHEEHAPVDLPEGNYELIIAREYTPKGVRKVVD